MQLIYILNFEVCLLKILPFCNITSSHQSFRLSHRLPPIKRIYAMYESIIDCIAVLQMVVSMTAPENGGYP